MLKNMLIEQNRSWLLMIATCLMVAMISIDFTAVNLALAAIAQEFHATISEVQWVIDSFVIAGAALLIIAGRFSDIFGKRKFFILGAIIFTAASAIAGFSTNIDLLIFSRTLQGVGLAIVFPVTMVLAALAFPENKRGLAIGITGAVSGLAQAIGPTFGGVVMQYLNWHWIFLFNLPIGALSIALTLLVCKKDIKQSAKNRIDFAGGILLALGLLLTIYALNEANNLSTETFWFLMIVGVFSLLGFIKLERKVKNPLIEMHLFSNKSFLSLNLIRGLFGYIFFSFIFIVGLYFQNILEYDAVHTGLLLLCVTIAYALLSPFSGKWIDVVGVKLPLICGIVSSTFGFLLLTNAKAISNWEYLILPLIFIGISIGIILPCATVAALKSVPHSKAGTASGILYTNASIGGAIGIGTTGALVGYAGLYYFKNLLSTNNLILNQPQLDSLTRIVSGTSSIKNLFANFNQVTASKLLPLAKQSFMHGFTVTMWACVLLTIVALGLTFFVQIVESEQRVKDV